MDKYKLLNPNLFPIHDGKYIIHSTVNDRFVWDIDPNSSNLHLWERHGGANQQFIFKSNGVGMYRIFCAQNGKALDCLHGSRDNGANVWAYDYNDTPAQHWHIKARDNNSVHIYFSVFSEIDYSKHKRCIDLCSSNAKNGANIWLYEENGTNAQKWYIEPVN